MDCNKVPTRLTAFCEWVNDARKGFESKSITELYNISFDAHYQLVTIHPWADGNGRMARLLMNMLQFEFGLILSKILKEDKEEYIKALVSTRENEDISIFRTFMAKTIVRNLQKEIDVYLKSTELGLRSGK